MLVKTYGSAVYGVDAITITVEVNVTDGLYTFLVGLPDDALKESVQRVESAIKTNGFFMPRTKIIINLAPAGMRKSGAAFDLPIALGILAASDQIPFPERLADYIIMGELGLDGAIHPIKGALPIAIQAKKEKFKGLILPFRNAQEAVVVKDLTVLPFEHLQEVVGFLSEGVTGTAAKPLSQVDALGGGWQKPVYGETASVVMRERGAREEVACANELKGRASVIHETVSAEMEAYPRGDGEFSAAVDLDFSDVRGHAGVKRALEIAAAGGHNALLIGPPGVGKTMLAQRLPSILPPLSLDEALETTRIHSVAGKIPADGGLILTRPFRSPHHTISAMALVGGSSLPQPGEISLAHNGVLFLDELPEFNRNVLEVMRQPMEDRRITISRASMSVDFPANFMLLASMNPCPCGYYNHPEKECVCPPGVIFKYFHKISGPLLDRIDLHIEVAPVTHQELMTAPEAGSGSRHMRGRVIAAREMQVKRYTEIGAADVHCNAQARGRLLRDACQLNAASEEMIRMAMNTLQLSARAYDRILKVSRTIADLDGSERIGERHLAEAIQFRSLDREKWI